ncbi:MAG: hypothetical protein JXA66_03275 [Oligoflexia bacterium]|nr:hypothetical protein [Oligoflexia bacterium]
MFEVILVSILLLVVFLHFLLDTRFNLPFIVVSLLCLVIMYKFLGDNISFLGILPFTFIFIFYFFSFKKKKLLSVREYVLIFVFSVVAFFLVNEIWFGMVRNSDYKGVMDISLFLFLPVLFLLGTTIVEEVNRNE